MSELKLAEIAIVISNREKSACPVNDLLTQFGDYIIARMGVPHRSRQMFIVSVVMEAPAEKITQLSDELNKLGNIQIKTMMM